MFPVLYHNVSAEAFLSGFLNFSGNNGREDSFKENRGFGQSKFGLLVNTYLFSFYLINEKYERVNQKHETRKLVFKKA
jgi:hypothetical protein